MGPDLSDEWTRRVGAEAAHTRRTVIVTQNAARGLLVAYVATLLIVFGAQGFKSTGERMWPNVLLFGSMLLVICGEITLTAWQQLATRRLRKQVSAVLARGTGETRPVIREDALLDMKRFDEWTARYRLPWFDGTVHVPEH
ncbi:hypothetical protein ACLBWP_13610 [Microbacterium sp. M1A1_1b]|uniref:hypothetical protein n=1 Tax=Curtobacterium sp. VKM Ac-2922 TaxID=2929475 RepID=UPI001FB1F78C|nr:hypothetical protein [Curtobacterium sp. VKM Ac-2922]MCJ1712897.1 hypothetical protein [Curtobacterium sp. VKM Ac-2922]